MGQTATDEGFVLVPHAQVGVSSHMSTHMSAHPHTRLHASGSATSAQLSFVTVGAMVVHVLCVDHLRIDMRAGMYTEEAQVPCSCPQRGRLSLAANMSQVGACLYTCPYTCPFTCPYTCLNTGRRHCATSGRSCRKSVRREPRIKGCKRRPGMSTHMSTHMSIHNIYTHVYTHVYTPL